MEAPHLPSQQPSPSPQPKIIWVQRQSQIKHLLVKVQDDDRTIGQDPDFSFKSVLICSVKLLFAHALSPGSHRHFDYATLQANDKMLGDNLNQFAEFSFDGQKERKFDAMKVVKPCVPGLWSLRLC